MAEYDLLAFFLQPAVMLLAAFIAGEAMRKIGQPAVLGEILGGIILGPSILGLVAPGIHSFIFTQSGLAHSMVNAFVNLGMLYFLFIAGMEIDLAQIRSHGRISMLISSLGIIVPFALGASAVVLLPGIWRSPDGSGFLFPVLIGTAMSISALPVIIRILMDLGLTRTRQGQIIITSAIINDLVGWSMFVYVLGMMTSTEAVHPLLSFGRILLLGAVVLLLGRFLGTRFVAVSRRISGEAGSLLATISVAILVGALAASRCGVHPVFGAFLVGVALGPALKHTPCAEVVIRQFAISIFAPLYFVSIGLRLDFARSFDLPLVALVVLLAFAGKLLGAGCGAWLGRLKTRDIAMVAFGLNARGAVEIILAGVALSAGVVDERIFLALVVMALLTTTVSVPVIRQLSRPDAVGDV
jgi:Kef-type K+ transport system membrane component KefB